VRLRSVSKFNNMFYNSAVFYCLYFSGKTDKNDNILCDYMSFTDIDNGVEHYVCYLYINVKKLCNARKHFIYCKNTYSKSDFQIRNIFIIQSDIFFRNSIFHIFDRLYYYLAQFNCTLHINSL